MSSGPPLGVLFALAAMCALCSSSSAAAGGFAFMGGSGSSNTPTGPAAGPAANTDLTYTGMSMTYPISNHTELGAGTSMGACRTLATTEKFTNVGFRDSTVTSQPNTCFGFNVSSQLNGKDLVPSPGHSVGCTDKTLDIKKGCDDTLVYMDKTMNYPAGGHTELGAGTSTGACRKLAAAAGKKTFGFRDARVTGQPNTCFAYNVDSQLVGQLHASESIGHFVGCVDPKKDINKGCV